MNNLTVSDKPTSWPGFVVSLVVRLIFLVAATVLVHFLFPLSYAQIWAGIGVIICLVFAYDFTVTTE